jgi:hypothetical protein
MSDADDIVRWTVAAFMSNHGVPHEELVDILRAAGVPRADHACAITPLAFGRQILDGLVELPSTYVLDGRDVAFADDALYVAAREQARHASREHIEAIGLRSAEVNAVNHALHAGSQPKDLVLAAPQLRITDDATSSPLARAQPLVAELVHGHGASLALEIRTFPGKLQRTRAQLQIDVIARDGEREIMESFAGLGETVAAAIANAVEKFARASLHVMLATLAGREHGHDQVDWERWRGFDVCSGPLLQMWSQPPPFDFAALLEAMRAALPELSRELHWVRIFVAVDDGKLLGYDAMLDNQTYQPFVELLQRVPWPRAEKAYALRHFMMLVPA